MTITDIELRVDPEFESKIPPLTEDEYRLLEENILSEGAVLMPLIVWNGTIVDGHNRYKILRENPDIPFTVHEKDFDNRYEAISWICKNQLGRRNLTPIQKRVLVGERYNAEKMSNGAHDGFRGNQYTNLVVGQNSPVPSAHVTRHKIADESGVTESFVKYAGQYSDGITAAEEVSPGFRQEVLSGKIKPTQREMRDIARAEPEERRSIMDKIFCPGSVKPDRKSAALVKKISEDMVKEKPGMTPQKAVKQFEWMVTKVLQDFDDTFDQWPQLVSNEDFRKQVTATLQDLKKYISQIEGGKRYEWDYEATVAARKLLNDGMDLPVLCKVYSGLTAKDEALLFAQQTGFAAKVYPGAKIRALVFAGEKTATAFAEATDSTGLRLSYDQARGKNRIGCVSAAYRLFQSVGEEIFTEALCLIAAAWEGHKDSMRTETIQGVIGFVDMYHDEYDPKRLVSRCQRFDPMHICRSAKAAGDSLPAPQRYIFEVWKMYNGSSRSHALPLKI